MSVGKLYYKKYNYFIYLLKPNILRQKAFFVFISLYFLGSFACHKRTMLTHVTPALLGLSLTNHRQALRAQALT